VADGPTIQKAGIRALAAGTTPKTVLDVVSRLRAETEVPIVLMTYANIVHHAGIEHFAADAASAGVDGVILPDVPLEESAAFGGPMARAGLDLVLLASPASGDERVARIARATRGFLYVVSSYGTTGVRDELAAETQEVVRRVRRVAPRDVPIAVGFGVSKAAQVRELSDAGADGVIVGSALVEHVAGGAAPGELSRFVKGLK
ncbi:MAG: tryptophan synthase subunit alpha, partial [Methanobacteriota archaeon]